MSDNKANRPSAEESEKRLQRQKKRILAQARRREHSLYTLNISVIVGIMAFITLFMTFGERPTVSTEENRDLAKCPAFSFESYFKGDFTNDFAAFYNDTVPLRSTFKSMISAFRANLGINTGVHISGGLPTIESRPESSGSSSSTRKPPPVVVIPQQTESTASGSASGSSTVSPANSSSSSGSTESTSTTSSSSREPVDIDPNGGMEIGSIIVLPDGRALPLFGGSYSGCQSYAETLNAYKQALGSNVNVYSLVSPTAVSFYLPDKFADKSASEWDQIDYINSFLNGVIPIDAYSVFEQHTAEDIFMRTDHHWSSLGAYYAAQEFARVAQVDFAELNDENYEKISREGYLGTLFGQSGEPQVMIDNPETFTYYIPRNEFCTDYYSFGMEYQYNGRLMLDIDLLERGDWYSVNMCGDLYTVNINTDCRNGRRLMIVKDSYGDALPAFLTNSFEEIWVVDMRWFESGILSLAESEGITDVLFAMNPTSATGENAAYLPGKMW
ncbi:MAG: DHHW family protein [Ruminococcus sp.]|nr:DHHW family protein [Ruminococcus sp.]